MPKENKEIAQKTEYLRFKVCAIVRVCLFLQYVLYWICIYICVYEGYIRFSQQFRFHTTTHLQTATANIYGWPNDNCIETKSADFTMCLSYNSNNTNENLNNCHAVSRIVMCIRQQCICTIVTFSSSLIHICFYSRVKKMCCFCLFAS